MSYECDVLISGAGTGGTAAAIKVLNAGYSVVLTDETGWPGGQITSQGNSALDEHSLMETFGGTKDYYRFREQVRDFYREEYSLVDEERDFSLNPGCAYRQRRLAFSPRKGKKALEVMLREAGAGERLKWMPRTVVVGVEREGRQILSARLQCKDDGGEVTVWPRFVIGATELGELLPLAGIPWRTGVEAFNHSREPSAPPAGNPEAVQSFVFPLAVEWCPGEDHTVEKPELYGEIRREYSFSFNGRDTFSPGNRECRFWTYRLIRDRNNFSDVNTDISLINCASIDYRKESLIGLAAEEKAKHLYRARQLSLSFLYWIQTEARREDGGRGYPGLKPRPDLMGTQTGLSRYPYIRESRRLQGLETIREQDIGACYNTGSRAPLRNDAAGIGWYQYIDLHWCCRSGGRSGSGQRVLPFQIPLGALLPPKMENFIAGAKNISMTHITNGVCRLQPVEWAVGEAAGVLAAYVLDTGHRPREVYNRLSLLREYQLQLLDEGIPLYWFDDLPLEGEYFKPLQYLALEGIVTGSADNLHIFPERNISRAVARNWLWRTRLRYRKLKTALQQLKEGLKEESRGRFAERIFSLIRQRVSS